MLIKILLFLTIYGCYISDFYDINVPDSKGKELSLRKYKGSKVLIYVADPVSANEKTLIQLDSLAQRGKKIEILVVPVSETIKNATATWQQSIDRTAYGKRLSFTQVIFGKRATKGEQHPLFRWLSFQSENGHFNTEQIVPGQMFTISPAGVLYGVIDKNTTIETVAKVLDDDTVK